MKIVKSLFQNTIYFKICYLMLSLFSIVPIIAQYSSKYFKLLLVYGMLIILYDLFTTRSIFKNKYSFLFLILIASMGLSTIINFDKGLISNGVLVCYSVIQFFILMQINPQKDYNSTRKEIFIFNNIAIFYISLVSLISAFCFFIGLNGEYIAYSGTKYESVMYYGVAFGNRLTGITSNPNLLGIAAIIAIVCIFINWFLYSLNKWFKICYIFCFLVNFMCFIMSGSRSAAVAGSVFFVICLFSYFVHLIKDRKRFIWKNILALLCSVLIVAGISLTFEPLKDIIGYVPAHISLWIEPTKIEGEDKDLFLEEHYVNLEREQDTSIGNGRMSLWIASLKVAQHHFLFGVGNSQLIEYVEKYSPNTSLPGLSGGHVHNILFQTQVVYGFITLICIILVILVLFKDFIKKIYIEKISNRVYYFPIFVSFAAIAAFFCNNMFEANILYCTSIMNCFFILYLGYFMYFIQNAKNNSNTKYEAVLEENL